MINTFKKLIYLFILGFVASCSNPAEVRTVNNIDFDWRFIKTDSIFDGSSITLNDSSWRLLDLPHDWSIEDSVKKDNPSGESGGYFGGGIAWYRKNLLVPEEYKSKNLLLTFDGIYMISEIYVNGKKIGSQSNGYITRTYDISPFITPGKSNIIAVRVDNSVQPFDRWYSGCGIYRHVWLTATNKVYIPQSGTYITTPEVNNLNATINLKIKVKNTDNANASFTLKTEIVDPKGNVVATKIIDQKTEMGKEVEIEQLFNVEHPMLWSPGSPIMYKAVTSIEINNKLQDKYTTPFGIRSIQFSPDSGFVLNNKKVVLKGVCIHHDLGGVGAAFYDKLMLRRLRLLKEMGCNAIRLSHNPYAPQLLDMCDSLGILVFNETFDRWEARIDRGSSKAISFKDSWRDDLSNFIERDRNHPSVFIWSVGNETYEQQIKAPRGIEIIKELVALVHGKDPSRKVTSAMHPGFLKDPEQFEISDYNDVASYNYSTRMFSKWRKADPKKIFLSTETRVYTDYGPLALGENPDFSGNSWFTLQKEDCGQFIWTGIDYFGESPGWPFRGFPWAPINTCGYKKGYAYFTQSLYAEKPMVHIAGFDKALSDSLINYKSWSKIWTGPPFSSHWNFPLNENDSITVLTFTNCETVQLFLNNELLGEQKLQDFSDRVIRWKIPFKKGVLKAVAKNSSNEVATHELRTAKQPAKILLETKDKTIAASSREIAIIDVTIADSDGIKFPYATHLVRFKVDGPAEILAVDNGDLGQHFSFKAKNINASEGVCQLIIKATGKKGAISIHAEADNLKKQMLQIDAY